MAYMTKEEWLATYPQYTSADYDQQFGTTDGNYTGGGTSAAQAPGPVFSLPMAENKLAPGVPAYGGYQEPNYGGTTPNDTHWLNTMNAFAPQGRADMERMLGMQSQAGGSAGGSGGGSGGLLGSGIARTPTPFGDYRPTATGVTQPTQNFSPAAEQGVTPQAPSTWYGKPIGGTTNIRYDDFGPLPSGGLNNPDGTVAFIKADGTVGYRYSDGKLYEPSATAGLIGTPTAPSGGLLS